MYKLRLVVYHGLSDMQHTYSTYLYAFKLHLKYFCIFFKYFLNRKENLHVLKKKQALFVQILFSYFCLISHVFVFVLLKKA